MNDQNIYNSETELLQAMREQFYAAVIADILDDINNEEMIERVRGKVLELCKQFPVYKKLGM